MRNCRDSFIKYVQTELPSATVHAIRVDPQYPEYEQFKINAINISFFNTDFSVHISRQVVSMDLLYEVELTGLEVAQGLFDILSNNFIPMYDYSIPGTPVLLDSQIYWDMDSVRFRAVPNDNYFHSNCTLDLRFNISS